jgi:hypothetical protein
VWNSESGVDVSTKYELRRAKCLFSDDPWAVFLWSAEIARDFRRCESAISLRARRGVFQRIHYPGVAQTVNDDGPLRQPAKRVVRECGVRLPSFGNTGSLEIRRGNVV